ncbi:MAG: hypothetical protein AAGJ87_14005, partial [Pseudomonadota bacterium]
IEAARRVEMAERAARAHLGGAQAVYRAENAGAFFLAAPAAAEAPKRPALGLCIGLALAVAAIAWMATTRLGAGAANDVLFANLTSPAAVCLVALAGLYAVAGLIVDAASRPSPAADDALARDAARTALFAEGGPPIDSAMLDAAAVRRQTIEIGRVATDGASARAQAPRSPRAPQQATQDLGGDIPRWRRPAEGPRFVETGFAAAPKSWRTDAYAMRATKISTGEPDAKQGFFPRGKQRSD